MCSSIPHFPNPLFSWADKTPDFHTCQKCFVFDPKSNDFSTVTFFWCQQDVTYQWAVRSEGKEKKRASHLTDTQATTPLHKLLPAIVAFCVLAIKYNKSEFLQFLGLQGWIPVWWVLWGINRDLTSTCASSQVSELYEHKRNNSTTKNDIRSIESLT